MRRSVVAAGGKRTPLHEEHTTVAQMVFVVFSSTAARGGVHTRRERGRAVQTTTLQQRSARIHAHTHTHNTRIIRVEAAAPLSFLRSKHTDTTATLHGLARTHAQRAIFLQTATASPPTRQQPPPPPQPMRCRRRVNARVPWPPRCNINIPHSRQSITLYAAAAVTPCHHYQTPSRDSTYRRRIYFRDAALTSLTHSRYLLRAPPPPPLMYAVREYYINI